MKETEENEGGEGGDDGMQCCQNAECYLWLSYRALFVMCLLCAGCVCVSE